MQVVRVSGLGILGRGLYGSVTQVVDSLPSPQTEGLAQRPLADWISSLGQQEVAADRVVVPPTCTGPLWSQTSQHPMDGSAQGRGRRPGFKDNLATWTAAVQANNQY